MRVDTRIADLVWGKIKRFGGASCLAMATAYALPTHAGVIDRPFFKASSVVIIFGADDFQENGGVAPVVYDFYLLDNVTSGTIGNDIIGVDGRTINFNTNTYNPIQSGASSGWEFQVNNPTFGGNFISGAPHQTLDANDAYTAFGIDGTTDIDLLGGGGRASRFYVTSNTAFDLHAQATNFAATGDFAGLDYTNIRYRFRHQTSGGNGANRWGADAQDPSVGGAGVVIGGAGLWTLDDIAAGPTKVFDGGRRTAATDGSIMSQAVSFQSRYNLRGAGITGNNYDFSMGTGSVSAEITYTVYAP